MTQQQDRPASTMSVVQSDDRRVPALVVGGGIVYLGAARVFGAFSIAEIKASVRGARQSN